MKDIKKKLFITGLTLAMVSASPSFPTPRVYAKSAEAREGVAKKEVKATTGVKALFTKAGTITGRKGDDTSNDISITNLETISDLMIDAQVTTIPANKFAGYTNITTLSFKGVAATDSTASKVATIGVNAFRGLGITQVILPKSLTSIEAGAFSNNKALTTVNFTNSINLQYIKTGAFENSGLTSLDLSPMDKNTTARLILYTNAFKGNTKLTSLTLSSKMTELYSEVFASTGLTTVAIGEKISTFDTTAFKGTPLTTISVDTKNESFSAEDNVLYDHAKTSIVLFPEGKADTEFTIKETVTHIEPYAFSSSPTLTTIMTSTGLTTIGGNAFDGASKLAKIELKESLSQIGLYAFRGTALTTIALPGSMDGIEEHAFAGATKFTKLDLRKATQIKTVKAEAFKDTALDTIVIGKNTGPLDKITTGAFHSSAASRKVSLLDDTNERIIGDEAAALITKYARLKFVANGSWTFDVKLPTPNATVDYTKMKLTGLVPNAIYTIENASYTADPVGEMDLEKKWGGKTISIAQQEHADQATSDAQKLGIDAIFTLTTQTLDGSERKLKKVGTSIHMSAPDKQGHVFKTWEVSGVSISDITQKAITFNMPSNDVSLVTKYTKIVVETPVLLYDKKDLVVTITTPLTNLKQLVVNGIPLKKGMDYTVSGTDSTVITLKTSYLDLLTDTTKFAVVFLEGGEQEVSVRLPKSAPNAVADYTEMKLTGLDANAQYKINKEIKTSNAQGKITIEKAWGGHTLEIIKVSTETTPESNPQSLLIQAFYTVSINGIEVKFTTVGTAVTVKAEGKHGYVFKEWKMNGITLVDASLQEVTFKMPSNNVVLDATYESIIATTPAELVYDGTSPVTIRFNLPMDSFQNIEYNGQLLVKDRDYIVVSGSTIVTFTKLFLDKMHSDMNNLTAIFTSGPVPFSIAYTATTPPVLPVPTSPKVEKTTTPTGQLAAKSPKTGDHTNVFLLLFTILLSIGTFIFVKKRGIKS